MPGSDIFQKKQAIFAKADQLGLSRGSKSRFRGQIAILRKLILQFPLFGQYLPIFAYICLYMPMDKAKTSK